jgi:hypothetical protein
MFYYITLGLQAICVIHCIYKRKQYTWLLLIIFIPLLGCLVYIFSEIFTGREIQNLQSGITTILNPSGSIKKLEENLRFSDTFNNKVMLADALLAAGQTDRAIELYESALTGTFTENEYVLTQLITAYFQVKRFAEIIPIAKKLYRLPQFPRSRAHILYAMALENTGNSEQAEKEFMTMKARFSDFEARYQYGQFLIRAGREEEARQIFTSMLDEASYLSPRERRSNRTWLMKTKEELKKTGNKVGI